MTKKSHLTLNVFSQFAIPIFTLGGQLALAMKYPEWALILTMIAQPFWLYSSWTSYKKAGQIGMFINSIAFVIITAIGIMNYWFL